jgi:hypothetical protein
MLHKSKLINFKATTVFFFYDPVHKCSVSPLHEVTLEINQMSSKSKCLEKI